MPSGPTSNCSRYAIVKRPSSVPIPALDSSPPGICGYNVDNWEVFTHGGRNNTNLDAIDFAKKMEDSGAGELLITSMDRDGTQIGYDNDLMFKISSLVNIPVIASGGVGNLDHLVDGIKLGNASAVLAASIFHYGTHSIKEAKQYLNSKGIPVRI